MDEVDKLTKYLNDLGHIRNNTRRDSSKFMKAEDKTDNLVFDYVTPQSFGVIKKGLHRILNNHDFAEAVIAYKNGEDIPTIFGLSPKYAKEFRIMMRFNMPKLPIKS